MDGTRTKPLALIVHNNTRWGSAFGMTKRVYDLRKVRLSSPHPITNRAIVVIDYVNRHLQEVDSFVLTADVRFGPITTIKKKGAPSKHIPWAAFMLSDSHWKRVRLCSEILEVCLMFSTPCSSSRSTVLPVFALGIAGR